MELDRREFILQFGAAAAALVFGPELAFAKKFEKVIVQAFAEGFAIADGDSEKATGLYKVKYAAEREDVASTVRFFNYKNAEVKSIGISFNGHQVLQNPHNVDQFLVVQRWGRNAALINFKTEEVRSIRITGDRLFFGHGLFCPDKKTIAISSNNYEISSSQVVFFEIETLKEIKTFNTYGVNLHQIQLSQDSTKIYCSNFGRLPMNDRIAKPGADALPESSFVALDLATGKLLSQKILSHNERRYAHFGVLPDESVFLVGVGVGSGPAALAFIDKSGEVRDLSTDPLTKHLNGEALNARHDPLRGRMVITFVSDGAVGIFDLKTAKFIKVLPLKKPNSVIDLKDGRHFLISRGNKDKFEVLDLKKLTFVSLKMRRLKKINLENLWARGLHSTEALF